MNVGDVYRIIGYGVYADIKIAGVSDNIVLCQRLKDGKIIEVERNNFERLKKTMIEL